MTAARLTSSSAISSERGRRFDQVERLVRTRYYTRDLHGVNWSELCDRYRPAAVAATDEPSWYRTVNAMLRELRDAHTRVERPEEAVRFATRHTRELVAPSTEVPFVRELEGGIVHVRFDHFDAPTMRWLSREVARHRNAKGMIIDLRRNRGGLVTAAQRAVGLFFAERVEIGFVIDRDGDRSVERSRHSRTHYLGPLTVLVGPGSHSSAEVFAAVMQGHGRGKVIGQPTAGEVLGARPYRLDDGGQLYISISDFLRCDGRRLEGEGVTPDVLIPEPEIGAPTGVPDTALATALQVLDRG